MTVQRLVRALFLAWMLVAGLLPAAAEPPVGIHVVTEANYPPLVYRDAEGKLVGYIVDVWRLWEARTGVPVKLSAVQWSEAQAMLLRGEADVIDLIYQTPPREPLYDFAESYLRLPVIMYAHQSITGLTDLSMLRDFQVGVQAGDACLSQLDELGITSRKLYPNYRALVEGAAAREVKLFCLDRYPADFYLYQYGQHREFVEAFELTAGDVRWAVKKGNQAAFDQVEQGMRSITAAERTELKDKWIGTHRNWDAWLRPLMATLGVAVLLALLLMVWVRALRAQVQIRTHELELERRALHLVINTIPDMVWLKDPDGRYRSCNLRFQALYGVHEAQLVGRTDFDFVPPAVAECFRHDDQQAMSLQGKTLRVEETLRFAFDGHEERVETLKTALFDEHGALQGVLGIARDMTAFFDARDELRHALKRLEQAERLAHMGHWELDLATGDMRWSAQVFEILGLSADACPSLDRLLQRIHPDDREALANALAGRESEGVWHKPRALLSCRAIFDDDSVHYLQMRAEPIQEVSQVVRLVGTLQDITDQKQQSEELERYRAGLEGLVEARTRELGQAVESLRVAHEEQQAIFDAGTVGIMLMRDQVVQRCNRQLERLLGYDTGEMLGRSTLDWYVDEPTFIEVGEAMQQAVQSGEAFSRDLELVRRDGSRFWARMRIHAIVRGQPEQGLAGMIEDVTVEREAMAEMERARQLAEDAARIKSDFLANMSHEIRTPMNAILGMTHLALKTELTQRQQDYLQRIQSSGKHLLDIINDVLDLSKIEAGKLSLEHTEFSVETLMQNLGNLIREKAADKGLELMFEIEPGVPPWLVGDPLRLGQVLINYGNNAVKFTEQGEIHVRVRVLKRADKRIQLHFSVRDTGIGMSEAQQRRLFQPFEQADASTTRQYGGTGLGLSISRSLAHLMSGEVGLTSRPGEGSTFWFTAWVELPAQKVAPLIPRPDLRGLRVLVVDDNDNALMIMTRMLEQLDFRPTAITSGREALVAIENADRQDEPFALVCLDQQMPGMDGLQTASGIHALSLQHPPALMMVTNFGRSGLHEAANRIGITEIINKPITPSDLFDAIIRLVHQQQTRDERVVEPASAAETRLVQVAGARLLLVEDNEINQWVACELLQDVGFVVETADNGLQAVERVRAGEQFDLILMDMQMPVMDGVHATREIRALPQGSAVPIVAMTANAMAHDRDQCLQAGMNDFVSKPIDPDTLWAALLRWIPPRSAVSANTSSDTPSTAPTPVQPPAKTPAPPQTQTGTAVMTPAAAAGQRLPAAVEGLDIKLGLSRCLNRPGLYRDLLNRFIDQYGDAPARIETALAAGDVKGAQLEAHSLRGVAGNLGATRVQHQAESLEKRLVTPLDGAAVGMEIAAVRDALSALMAALSRAFVPEPTRAQVPDTGPVLDDADSRQLIDTLLALLDQGDPMACEQASAHTAALRALLGQDYPVFIKALDAFDFERAARLLSTPEP